METDEFRRLVAITLDLYSHVIEGVQREAARVMDDLVGAGA